MEEKEKLIDLVIEFESLCEIGGVGAFELIEAAEIKLKNYVNNPSITIEEEKTVQVWFVKLSNYYNLIAKQRRLLKEIFQLDSKINNKKGT